MISFSVLANDPDLDPLAYSVTGLPAGAVFANQVFSWTPAKGQAGQYVVSFQANDGEFSAMESVLITVTAVTRKGSTGGGVKGGGRR